jgi:hypothetical protein
MSPGSAELLREDMNLLLRIHELEDQLAAPWAPTVLPDIPARERERLAGIARSDVTALQLVEARRNGLSEKALARKFALSEATVQRLRTDAGLIPWPPYAGEI